MMTQSNLNVLQNYTALQTDSLASVPIYLNVDEEFLISMAHFQLMLHVYNKQKNELNLF